MRYWDGQPVRFVCCERKRENEDGGVEAGSDSDVPWGRVLWCIAIELVVDDDQSQPQPGSHPPNAEANEAEHHFQSGGGDGLDGVD